MPKAFLLVGPRQFEIQETADVPLGPRQARLQSVISGISHGTEMNLYRGTAPFAEKHFDGEHRLFMPNEERRFRPMKLGYEMVSRVIEVGSAVTEIAPSSLVHSATNHQTETVVDLDLDAQAQIPMQALPPGVTADAAIFAALVGVALVAIHDAQIKVGDHVAIIGQGTIGLIATQLARLDGALRVTAVDPIPARREMALRLGADEAIDPACQDAAEVLKLVQGDQHGPDVVIEASGNYDGLQTAIRCAHVGGTVVTLGYYQGGATPVHLGEEWHHNRLNLVSSMGVWGCPSRFHPMWDRRRASRTALELLDRGLITVEPLITQRFPFERAPEAYRFIDERPSETIKVVLTYE